MGYTLQQQRQKEQAKNVNLVNFLLENGVGLIKESNYYRHDVYNSLIVFRSKKRGIYNWIWNSTKQTGTAIDYLMSPDLEFGYDYNKTITELNSFSGTTDNCFSEKEVTIFEKDFDIKDIKLNRNISRTIAYLTKTRNIDMGIVQFCIDNKLISQTIEYTKTKKEIANLAFLMRDENNKIVGIEKNTLCSDSKYKGISKNSKYGYGFSISMTNDPKYIFYFESAIDLLSFIQVKGREKVLKNLDKCMLISLSGLKENILKQAQDKYNNPQIYLCTDNINLDKASRNFVGQIKVKHENVKIISPGGLYKDWNDVIRDKI